MLRAELREVEEETDNSTRRCIEESKQTSRAHEVALARAGEPKIFLNFKILRFLRVIFLCTGVVLFYMGCCIRQL